MRRTIIKRTWHDRKRYEATVKRNKKKDGSLRVEGESRRYTLKNVEKPAYTSINRSRKQKTNGLHNMNRNSSKGRDPRSHPMKNTTSRNAFSIIPITYISPLHERDLAPGCNSSTLSPPQALYKFSIKRSTSSISYSTLSQSVKMTTQIWRA